MEIERPQFLLGKARCICRISGWTLGAEVRLCTGSESQGGYYIMNENRGICCCCKKEWEEQKIACKAGPCRGADHWGGGCVGEPQGTKPLWVQKPGCGFSSHLNHRQVVSTASCNKSQHHLCLATRWAVSPMGVSILPLALTYPWGSLEHEDSIRLNFRKGSNRAFLH